MIFLLTVVTAFFSWLAVGKLITVLRNHKMVDHPNERTLHQGQIPRGGGVVMVSVLLLSLIVVAIVSTHTLFFTCLALYVACWALLSWYDDRVDASAGIRFACQLVFAIGAVLAFGYVDTIQLSDNLIIPLGLFGAFLTVTGIVWLANLYNFMDGMDGLAASQTIIVSITLAFWFFQAGATMLSICCLLLTASTYGFLLWNWSPAKIFMGDVGSVVIGAWFALLTVIGVNYYDMPVLSFALLLSVFVFDASITLMKRLLRREAFWQPHRTHHYQRLATAGYIHEKIVLVMLCLMMICSILASISLQYRDILWLCVLIVVILLLSSVLLVHYLEQKQSET